MIRLSTPTRFGEKYASALEAAGNVRLLLWTNVTHIEMDGAGRAGALRTATLTGLTREIRARLVVIACGAVENARLMLASNARNGRHFGDAGGFLGACYMDHVAGGAGFLHFREPPGPKAYWTEKRSADGVPVYHVWRLRDAVLAREELANAHFYIIPFSEDPEERRRERDARHSLASLKSIAKWALGYRQPGFRLSEAYCSFINKADSLVAQGWTDMGDGTPVRRALLRYEAEQQPDRASHVRLSGETDALGQPKAALHWSPQIADRESIVRSTVLIGQHCGAADLGRVEIEDHFDARYWDASTTYHALGTTRMAVAPADGVTDPNGRVHGTHNLYMAGGSTMPSTGRANPTLTIVALALRLADHLKSAAGELE